MSLSSRTDIEPTPPSASEPPVPTTPSPPIGSSPGGSLLRLVVVVAAVIAVAVALGAGDVVIVIVAIVIMVMVHELGHFATAKWSGMKVTEYFLGFGPRLWSIKRGETEYGIKAIPAGGYVKIPGMTNLEEVDPKDEARTYRQKPIRNRLLVASAGSFMHFVMAFLLAWGVLVFIGAQSPASLQIAGFTHFDGISKNPAQLAGLKVGDVIVGVNGHKITQSNQLTRAIEDSAGGTVKLLVERNGKDVSLIVHPLNERTLKSDGKSIISAKGSPHGAIGVELESENVPESPIGALGGAGVIVGRTTSEAVTGLGTVFSAHGLASYYDQVTNSQIAVQDQHNGTPRPESIIGAARTAVQGAEAGTGELIEVLIALNIFIGMINMLPMLPLDGGHVVIALYERLRTRRGRPYYQADAAKLLPVAYAFIVVMLVLVSSSVYLDITHPVANPFG